MHIHEDIFREKRVLLVEQMCCEKYIKLLRRMQMEKIQKQIFDSQKLNVSLGSFLVCSTELSDYINKI